MKKLLVFFENRLCFWGIVLSSISIFLMTTVEVLNVFGRKFYKPWPCTVETAEALMIVAVLMGAGYVTLKEEHVNVTIVTRKMRPLFKRLLDALGSLFGAGVFTILAWGAWLKAWASIMQLEMRIGVYQFPLWPFRIIFAVGLTMMALQAYFNTVKFISQAFDPEWEPPAE
jgi:TRAP-type C4-dicarboxylate transport system permease small subunit